MQTADVLLALGGDQNNQIPKYGITAAEAAVLQSIHGPEAVREINITGDVRRTHRQEIGRLRETYGRQENDRRIAPAVDELFPGAAARVFEDFDELELPEEFFVAASRRTSSLRPSDREPETAPQPAVQTQPLEKMKITQLQAHAQRLGCDLTGVTKKADIVEAIQIFEANMEPEEDEDADEIGDIDDEHADGMFA